MRSPSLEGGLLELRLFLLSLDWQLCHLTLQGSELFGLPLHH